MSKHNLTLSILVAFGFLALLGCRADTTGLVALSVSEVAAILAAQEQATICDANTVDTRAKLGVIPGAVLLSNYRDYAVSELPADRGRRLIFYCYNPMCSSAAEAARKAIAGGYTDVTIMPDGIQGWVGAEQPVSQPQAS